MANTFVNNNLHRISGEILSPIEIGLRLGIAVNKEAFSSVVGKIYDLNVNILNIIENGNTPPRLISLKNAFKYVDNFKANYSYDNNILNAIDESLDVIVHPNEWLQNNITLDSNNCNLLPTDIIQKIKIGMIEDCYAVNSINNKEFFYKSVSKHLFIRGVSDAILIEYEELRAEIVTEINLNIYANEIHPLMLEIDKVEKNGSLFEKLILTKDKIARSIKSKLAIAIHNAHNAKTSKD